MKPISGGECEALCNGPSPVRHTCAFYGRGRDAFDFDCNSVNARRLKRRLLIQVMSVCYLLNKQTKERPLIPSPLFIQTRQWQRSNCLVSTRPRKTLLAEMVISGAFFEFFIAFHSFPMDWEAMNLVDSVRMSTSTQIRVESS